MSLYMLISSLQLLQCENSRYLFFQIIVCIMAGKFLHVMAVLFDQSHAAAVTTNPQSVHTWKFHSAIDRTSERERDREPKWRFR